MCAHLTFGRLERFAFAVLLMAVSVSAVSAQTPAQPQPDLQSALVPGRTVWITDTTGREGKMQVVSVSDDAVTLTANGSMRRLGLAEVRRVRARQSDSVLEGALIGAGAAIASGYLLCRAMESGDVCRNDAGPLFRMGAVGAAIGIGVDALIRGRKTIYQAPHGAARLDAVPIVGFGAAGVRLSVSF